MNSPMPREMLIDYIRNALAETQGDYYLEGYVKGEQLLAVLDDPILLMSRQVHDADIERRRRDRVAAEEEIERRKRLQETADRERARVNRQANRDARTITLPSGRKVVLP